MAINPKNLEPKPAFKERIALLLPDKKDQEDFWTISKIRTRTSIRCNTLKIQPEELKQRLEERHNWEIEQPFKDYPEIMVVKTNLLPGEIGKAREHTLGYYYVQELASMMPMLALKPNENDTYLDLCSSPGSKTTQAAAMMKNKGVIIANDASMGRIGILASNLEKQGVSNCLITRKKGEILCEQLAKERMQFSKILVDAPCSGEGTLRSSPKTYFMWRENMFNQFASIQKRLAAEALKILEPNGEMIYSTCTLSPEEDEQVIDYLLKKFDIEILPVKLPIKTREGVTEWKEKKLNPKVKNCARVWPQDNDTDGFFICKIKKLSNEVKEE